jgi:hypothetical protein
VPPDFGATADDFVGVELPHAASEAARISAAAVGAATRLNLGKADLLHKF